MTISYPLDLPSSAAGFASIKIKPKNAVAVSKSPFTMERKTFQHPGQQWEASVTITRVPRNLAAPWKGFLTALNGPVGTFLMGDPDAATPRGSASSSPGTPLVAGASQTGNSLNIDGCPLSATGYLLTGDYIQIGTGTASRLHMVLTDVDTDGSGAATLDLWPSMASAPSDNSTVVVSGAVGTWGLMRDGFEWDTDYIASTGITFRAESIV